MSNLVEFGRQEANAARKSTRRAMLDWFSSLLREEREKAKKTKSAAAREVVERLEQRIFEQEQEIWKEERYGR